MKNLLYPCALALIGAQLSGCGSEELSNERQQTLAALDAKKNSQVYLAFQLPDRKGLTDDQQKVTELIDSYYFRFAGQGPDCPTVTQQHEEWGVYEDKKVVGAKVLTSCDYSITIKLGSSQEAEAGFNLAPVPINYQDHIQGLIQTHCLSCHGDWQEWKKLANMGPALVNAVENGTMPPNQALSDRDLAMFLAWADGGFLENNPKPIVSSDSEARLKRVFYRNNHDDVLNALELYGFTTKDLKRSLWIQEEGLAAQLQTRQLYTFPYAAQ